MSTGSQRSIGLQTICLLRLTQLAPDIVEAILDGRQPEGMTLPALMEPFPVEWERQRSHANAKTTV
jgi:hypothetical protein